MSNNLLNDFFNPVTKTDRVEASIEFKPSPKKGQGGVYNAVVRFLPHPYDPNNKSILAKYTCYLTHPRTGEKRNIDDPSSVGERSILADTFFNLRNHPNPICKENANQFSRKQRFASLIQVLSCSSQKELEGRILVWRYGFKVFEKLQAEMNPPIGEPHNPFNLITGRPFIVTVKEAGGYPNYDGCYFVDIDPNQSGFRIQVPNAQGQLVQQVVTSQTIATAEGQKAVLDYLQKNAPDMTSYEYHPMTDSDMQFVNECIQVYSNPELSVQAANQRTYGAASAATSGQNPQQLMCFPQQHTATTQQAAGLQMPSNAQAPQPMGLNVEYTPNIPEGIIPAGAGAPTAPSDPSATGAPAMGLNLNDVLAGQMI